MSVRTPWEVTGCHILTEMDCDAAILSPTEISGLPDKGTGGHVRTHVDHQPFPLLTSVDGADNNLIYLGTITSAPSRTAKPWGRESNNKPDIGMRTAVAKRGGNDYLLLGFSFVD